MKIYTLLLESFYYDGDDDFVIDDVETEVHNFINIESAKDCMEKCIDEELHAKYTLDMLTRDGDEYAVFKEKLDDYGDDFSERIAYRLTIYERELEK